MSATELEKELERKEKKLNELMAAKEKAEILFKEENTYLKEEIEMNKEKIINLTKAGA
jgi:hypothetical protein